MAHPGNQGDALDKALEALKKDPKDSGLQAAAARAQAAYDNSLADAHQK